MAAPPFFSEHFKQWFSTCGSPAQFGGGEVLNDPFTGITQDNWKTQILQGTIWLRTTDVMLVFLSVFCY